MTQAVEDGATRPVYYESRVIRLNLDEDTLRLIDAEYEALAENTAPCVIEKSKRELGQMEAILGADQTIASLVDDILYHYEHYRADLLTGKAMIVAYSRPIALKIYKRILQLRPDWTEKGGRGHDAGQQRSGRMAENYRQQGVQGRAGPKIQG